MDLAREISAEPIVDNSFSVSRIDNMRMNTEYSTRLSYHQILLLKSGEGVLNVDNTIYTINGDEVILLAKGQVYQFESSSIISGYAVSFGDCFWERTPQSASNCKAVLFNNAVANQRLQLSSAEITELIFVFEALLDEYSKPEYSNQMDVLAAYLKILMIKLANVKIIGETIFESQDYLLYRQFLELLSNQFRNLHAVTDYAVLLNITARRLSEICKRCCGKSAKEIINGQLVAEAKRALQFSSNTVKEIAYELNFNTPEQFSHFFKRNTNIAPGDYRSQFINIGL